MSVLTKLFVILLVVLSLVLTSGMIVLVNKLEPKDKLVAAAQLEAARQTARAVAAEQQTAVAQGQAVAATIEANARSTAAIAALNAKTAEVANVQSQMAAEQTGRAKAEADAAAAILASQGALKTVDAQQKVINDTAGKLTGVEKQYTESQTRIAQLTQELDGAKAANRRLREDVVALNERLDQMGQGTRGQGAVAPTGGAGNENVVNLRGVVKAKRLINGIEYATISLGSADNVVKGMKFKVINANNFLGYLTIDSVEPNESVGHLEGPNLAMVGPNSEVRTQW